jgi:hypothetical protein
MNSVFHDTRPILHQQVILSALMPLEIELIDRIKICCRIFIELGWQGMEHVVDGRDFHSWISHS